MRSVEMIRRNKSVLRESIEAATIHNEIYGSDHCPVGLELCEAK